MSDSSPLFGTPDYFAQVKALLESDGMWAQRSEGVTCSMVYIYGDPMNRAMKVDFDKGTVTNFQAVDPSSPPSADLVISARGSVWHQIATQQLKPTLAMATGKLKLKGKQTFVLKNMGAFTRLMELQTQIEVRYDV